MSLNKPISLVQSNQIMRKILSISLLILGVNTYAQISITNGKHSLEISGAMSTYYNYRFYKDSLNGKVIDDYKKNRFKLKDAQFQLEGRYGNEYEYELQIDLADLANLGEDPTNPGLMDAYFKYKGFKPFDIQLGYGKTPYSRSSLTPFIYSVYWQRAQIARGDFFGRRDIGVTLSQDFWKQRINVYLGAYTGLSEISIKGDNDASGKLEYIGRVDIAYPSRFRYREIDDKVSPIPMFALGINGRYANKVLPDGETFPSFSTGEFGTKLISGKKTTIGADFAFQFKGFSLLAEYHRLKITPQDTTSSLLAGLPMSKTEGYVLAGGSILQMNYYAKSLKTIVSARWEQLNINDLIKGESQRLSIGIAYQLKGFNSMIKAQYFHVLTEEDVVDPLKWTNQIRVGWQYLFR